MALFRQAALQAQQTEWLGQIVMLRPLSLTVLISCCVGATALLLAFAAGASYTARTTVSGKLMPHAGLVQVYVPQAGIVVEKLAQEGQRVNQGDTLFVISGERSSVTRGDTQAGASEQIALRRSSLLGELAKTRQLQQSDEQALVDRIALLLAELDKLDNQLAGQANRVRLAEESLARANLLLQQRFISREQVQQHETSVLEQRLVLQQLEREQIGLQRDLKAQRSQRASLPLRGQAQLSQLDRLLSSTEQELNDSEARRRLLVTAPGSGTVTALAAEQGQTVEQGTPLLAIVPAGSPMQAELTAPSRAIGFIHPGQTVQLRYQAYPYQKFGHARGVVRSVTRTTVAADAASGREAGYRIVVTLDSQTVQAYGQAQPLQAGMALEADILHEQRRLYEWVLDPLYSLTGRM